MRSLFIITLILITTSCKQTLTSADLLDKAIAYHDPNKNWPTFNGQLNITMEIPEKSSRHSEIQIDLISAFCQIIAKCVS